MISRGNLQPAHRGYRYQDIATAYVLVRSLVERFDKIIVDRKQVDDDRIDDLEITAHGLVVRRQFKSSKNPNRVIATADFTGADSSLRIDRLVLTYVRAGQSPAHEYRLCATWQLPTDSLADLLEPIEAVPTFERWPSRHFRLRGERLWPADAPPLWQPLVPYTQAGAEFSRDELLAFCQRFIIELALPIASTDLRQPGPLEQAVIDDLSDRVGIGRYPNQGRQPSDVAALCVSLANLARTQEATLVPSEIEWALDIRTDFGRVAQSVSARRGGLLRSTDFSPGTTSGEPCRKTPARCRATRGRQVLGADSPGERAPRCRCNRRATLLLPGTRRCSRRTTRHHRRVLWKRLGGVD